MKIKYQDYRPRKKTVALIEQCNSILESYFEDGYTVTLRQLYYQLVSQDIIPNNQKEYDKLGVIVSKARLGGLIDWEHIVDRTRGLKSLSHWENPDEIIRTASTQFKVDKWKDQPFRPEVWIEKDALAGVFERVCNDLDVPYFSCRGYTSQSEMHTAAKRLESWKEKGQTPIIFHFGDHDPSGLDMTRDIKDRLDLFSLFKIKVDRLALNISQVEEYQPPPNPAKVTDSRANLYIKEFGKHSWELDALKPEVLANLVRDQINSIIEPEAWKNANEEEKEGQAKLLRISENFQDVTNNLMR